MCIELDQVKQEMRLNTIAQFLVLLTISTVQIYLNLWYLYGFAFINAYFLKFWKINLYWEMNSGILEVNIYEVMGTSYMQRHHALNTTLGSFMILGIIKIPDLGIHLVNVENLSWSWL